MYISVIYQSVIQLLLKGISALKYFHTIFHIKTLFFLIVKSVFMKFSALNVVINIISSSHTSYIESSLSPLGQRKGDIIRQVTS